MPGSPLSPGSARDDAGFVAADAVVLQFASNLKAAIEGRTLDEVAAASGIDAREIVRISLGEVVPTVDLVEALEHALDSDLWPRREGP